MKKNIRSSRKDLDGLKLYLLKKQISNIYENIPFYREFFDKQNITLKEFKKTDDLKKLPIITKEDIRDNMETFLNSNMDLEKCFS